MIEDLAELETRVTQRFFEKVHVDWPLPEDPFDLSDWTEPIDMQIWTGLIKDQPSIQIEPYNPYTITGMPPLDRIPQFPRQQWLTYPARRRAVLMIADRLLDLYDKLTTEQRTQLAFLLDHGGRERIG